MEVVDNLIMIVIPGAMDAPLGSGLFWGSRWLIGRGRGHAVVHQAHGAGHGHH
jgi:hypothetical protein